MARSRKKTPKMKITGNRTSNKIDRSLANRKFRRKSRVLISKNSDPLISLNEVSDPWGFASDGLAKWGCRDKYMRK